MGSERQALTEQPAGRHSCSVVVAVSDMAVRRAIVTRLALVSGLNVDVREGPAREVSERDVVIATPPDCSPKVCRELVQRGARVILVSAAHPARPHRHYLRVGLRSCVSLHDLWGEALVRALREAIGAEERAAR